MYWGHHWRQGRPRFGGPFFRFGMGWGPWGLSQPWSRARRRRALERYRDWLQEELQTVEEELQELGGEQPHQ